MKIHEYQAKEIFRAAGIPVPPGRVAATVQEAVQIADEIARPVMVKAQVHVGGRGKAGGIKYAENLEAAKIWAQRILGMDIKGLTVKKVLVTEATEIATETYLGIILDRVTKKPVIMISGAGGIDIEEVAAKTPEKIHKLTVDPQLGLLPYQARTLAFKVFRDISLVRQVTDIIMKLYDVYWKVDASLVEINPLVTTPINQVIALDAKINIDDNGLYRHPEIEAMRDPDAENPAEVEAREAGLSFIKLDGNIGCIVNGAGLAMATMDLVKHYGGEPANFLDIGGSSNPEKVLTAMRIILREPGIRAVLINIFGGITRCDDVATGIVAAFRELHPTIPVVVRLTGTNEAAARKILKEVQLETAPTLDAVVQTAIKLAGLSEE
ncbi:MAG: ADP-forming succinate--CoA ligase subunit beta [candidate division Zixibacteria bacterium]|nr:ADP-forming succinate--CoA ligase subunit beta [candidate division Zixibacteria bacterium]